MDRENSMKKIICGFSIVLILGIISFFLFHFFFSKTYTANDFNIQTITTIDCNHNGLDDYQDIVLGARKDALKRVKYKSAYYAGGYPPEDEGVCTDMIWRAFQEAGYMLKDMVDEDIQLAKESYYGLDKVPDPNIDFRRVSNLKVYFERHSIQLTTDIQDIASFQPGDIVVFGNDKHIGIISDKRNKKGIPYLLHNTGQWNREENVLEKWVKKYGLIGHYRINSSQCSY